MAKDRKQDAAGKGDGEPVVAVTGTVRLVFATAQVLQATSPGVLSALFSASWVHKEAEGESGPPCGCEGNDGEKIIDCGIEGCEIERYVGAILDGFERDGSCAGCVAEGN